MKEGEGKGFPVIPINKENKDEFKRAETPINTKTVISKDILK